MRVLILLAFYGLIFAQMPWPHPPQNQEHPIGNAWGNYQDYGTGPYLHNGQDILTPALWPVTAIKYGYVKRIWQSGQLYTGITVADSAGAAFCEGYMYYHVDPSTIQVSEGDTVYVGDTIAQIVTWPAYSFHHNHFSKNRNSGTIWTTYGAFFKNPLTEFTQDYDSTAPVFTDAVTGQKFAICVNNTSTYIDPDSVYGDVDFICRFKDRINDPSWWCIIYKVEYSIYDTSGTFVVPPMIGFQFSDSLDSYSSPNQVRIVFKDDATCNSNCDYINDSRRYYYIFTNSDGDSLIQGPDSLQCWQTTGVPNGPYWVKAVASDEYGNSIAESMLVYIRNPTGIQEQDITDSQAIIKNKITVLPNPSRKSVVFELTALEYIQGLLTIYDVSGKVICTLSVNTHAGAERAYVTWNRHDKNGRSVPAGVYYVGANEQTEDERVKFILLH